MIGTPSPVFPGFEIDISEHVPNRQKPDAIWHNDRAKAMLQAHPEIRTQIGHTRSTAIWCILFALMQVGLAIAVAEQPIWMMILAAYLFGSWININLFMLAHECNHGLVFSSTTLNRWLYTFTSMPMFLSGHHTWWIEHHVHHTDLGAKKDFIKRRRTFFLLTRYLTPLLIPFSMFMLVTQAIRSTVGLISYFLGLFRGHWKPGPLTLSILADAHLVSGYRKYRMPLWPVVYAALSLALPIVLFTTLGWKPVVYLLLSQSFMTGFLHPIMFGMILSNSHFHGSQHYQPSSSYYGWFNKITFNFGYHTEHHDLSSIPWSRLPTLRKMAPEFYDPLHQTKSYTGLALCFAFQSYRFDGFFNSEEIRNAEMLRGEPTAQTTM